MDYNVIKIEAKVVTKTGQNQGKKYVTCTIQDEDGNEREVPVFGTEAKPYLDCIAIAKGGTNQTDQPIPEKKAKWTYCIDEEFAFPEPMVRVDENNQPIRNSRGQIQVRPSVMVFTRYRYDEQRTLLKDSNGNPLSPLTPIRGWDRVTRGTSIMNAFYMPKKQFEAAAGPGDDEQPV